jgi:hypothetical protein
MAQVPIPLQRLNRRARRVATAGQKKKNCHPERRAAGPKSKDHGSVDSGGAFHKLSVRATLSAATEALTDLNKRIVAAGLTPL